MIERFFWLSPSLKVITIKKEGKPGYTNSYCGEISGWYSETFNMWVTPNKNGWDTQEEAYKNFHIHMPHGYEIVPEQMQFEIGKKFRAIEIVSLEKQLLELNKQRDTILAQIDSLKVKVEPGIAKPSAKIMDVDDFVSWVKSTSDDGF